MQPDQAEHSTPNSGGATAGDPKRVLTVIEGGRALQPEPPDDPPNAAAAEAEVRDAGEAIPVAPWLLLTDTDLASVIADAERDFQARMDALKPQVDEIKAMRAHLLERMLEQHAARLAHPDLEVAVTRPTSSTVYVDVLRQLDGLVPAEELKKGLYLFQPEPAWKYNLTHLKPLRKYGDEVCAILDKAIAKIEGPPRLIIQPKELDEEGKVRV